jgi:hypothetical protein
MFPALLNPNTPYDWNYTTTPQVGFNGRSIDYREPSSCLINDMRLTVSTARGHLLGGSTSVSEQNVASNDQQAILNLSQTTWPIHEEALKSGIVMRDSVVILAGHGAIFSHI